MLNAKHRVTIVCLRKSETWHCACPPTSQWRCWRQEAGRQGHGKQSRGEAQQHGALGRHHPTWLGRLLLSSSWMWGAGCAKHCASPLALLPHNSSHAFPPAHLAHHAVPGPCQTAPHSSAILGLLISIFTNQPGHQDCLKSRTVPGNPGP